MPRIAVRRTLAIPRVLLVALCVLALCDFGGGASAQPANADEDHVKAGFLFNFARFVEWPSPAPDPLVIGVIGADGFATALEQVIAGRTVEGRRVQTRRLREDDDLASCQVLFISASWRGRPQDVLQRARGPVLTIGESVQFLREGGIIRFQVEQKRVKFQISRENAATARLKISSHLLNLATP